MATKAGITSAVNALITAVVDIPEHRASMLELINEMYPTVVTDDYVSQTYTTNGATVLRYNITIHKSGNSCHIKGIVTNPQTNVSIGGGNLSIFTWKSNQYKPKSGVNSFAFKAMSGPALEVNFFLDDAGLWINGAVPANTAVSFDYKFYIAQD